MAAKKFLGQHFLHDPRILGRIADAAQLRPDDDVIEIGPGRGALTRELLARGARLTGIEKDRDLIGDLRREFPLLRLAEGDALELDWRQLAGVGDGPLIITGNIPYNITSPLLDKALTPPRPTRVVFLVQKEVADRLAAAPGTKAYGGLTVGVRAVAMVERIMTVGARSFQPVPRVDSAVVRLTPTPSRS
jgi:16S rRNA (adenine1518-N6/adenine1519-N6)-dimethyltransferase